MQRRDDEGVEAAAIAALVPLDGKACSRSAAARPRLTGENSKPSDGLELSTLRTIAIGGKPPATVSLVPRL
jgi:hypothetical protein